MLRSQRILLICLCAVLSVAALAQRGGPRAPTTRDRLPVKVEVHVVADDDRPVPVMARVQLIGTEAETKDALTNMEGVAKFTIVGEGVFKVRVSGPGIEDTQTEMFQLNSWERFRVERVRVKMKDAENRGASRGPAYTSATELRVPDKARKEFNKGLELLKKREWAKARDRFEAAIARYPQYDSAYDTLGIAKQNSGDFAGAKAAYEKALQINPRNPNALRDMAGILILEKQWVAASEMLKKSQSLDPQNPGTLTMLAVTQLALGEIDDVISTARRVHRVEHQDFANAHLILARALEIKGDKDAALAEYRVYLMEAPNDSRASDARSRIERLTAQQQTETLQAGP